MSLHPGAILWVGLYLSLVLLIGYTALCWIRISPRHWSELFGLSFASGMAILSFLLADISMCGLTPNRWLLSGFAAISILSFVVQYHGRRLMTLSNRSCAREGKFFTPAVLLGIVLMGSATASVAVISHWPGLNEMDVYALWLFKAKWVSLLPLNPMPRVFLDPTLSYAHQDYPLCMPLFVSGFYALIGRVDESAAKLLCVPIYLALMLVIYGGVRRLLRRDVAVCLTAVFVSGPVLCHNAGLLVAETTLLLALAGTFSSLLRWAESSEPGDLILTLFFAAMAAFTKNEGLALLPVIAITTLIVSYRRSAIKQWLCAAGIGLTAILPWLLYRIRLPKTYEDYGGKLSHPSVLLQDLPRVWQVFPTYGMNLFDPTRVGCIWLLLLLSVLLFPRFKGTSKRMLYFILAMQLLLYLMTFIVTPWEINELMPLITAKLLTQASVIGVLLIAMHLRESSWGIAQK